MIIYEIVLVFYCSSNLLASFLEDSGIEIITKYDTVLIFYNKDVIHSHNFKLIMKLLIDENRPLINMNENTETSHIHTVFSQDFASVVFLSHHGNLLKILSENIRHIRQTPVIIFIPKGYGKRKLFEYLWKQRIINVAVIEDTLDIIWTYSNFPHFKIDKKLFFHFETMNNFNGSHFRVMWGDAEPRTIRYKNHEGKIVIGGYAGAVIPLFAETYNVKVVDPIPVDLNRQIYAEAMERYIKNDTIDLSTSLKYGMDFSNQSYPLETFKYCVILPIDYDMKTYEYYGIIFRKRMWILVLFTFLINSAVLKKLQGKAAFWSVFAITFRSMLGQAYNFQVTLTSLRFYYANMDLQGVLVTIFYISLLSSILVRMPLKPQINTFEELYESKLKVWVLHSDWESLLKNIVPQKKYYKSFELIDQNERLDYERSNFNTSQGYTMPSDRWRTLNGKQVFMKKKIFRFTDICFLDGAMLTFPIDENSMFKQMFNNIIFNVKDFGFLNYFHSRSLYENVLSGRMSIQDESIVNMSRILRLEDIQIFFFGYIGFLLISLIVFFIELKNKRN